MTAPTGILYMAYGTPQSLAEVEPYYTHIRGGRPPSPELLAELVDRYRAIGGRSPLLEITCAQAEAATRLLNHDPPRGWGAGAAGGTPAGAPAAAGAAGDAAPGTVAGATAGTAADAAPGPFRAYVGMKHWHPYIAEAVAQMARDGIRRAVGLVLTPQYSRMSVGQYLEYVEKALAQVEAPIAFTYVESWHLHPAFVAVLASRVREALGRFPDPASVPVVFTAHSLPARIAEEGDPYPRHLAETAAAVAQAAGVSRWITAYQSAGRSPVPWLGPDIKEVLQDLHRQGDRAVLVCPAGFVADHLEVLYDIDIECQGLAAELGMRLERTASLNAAPDFAAALAAIVRDHLEAQGSAPGAQGT